MTRHRLSFLLHPERSGRVTLTARLACEGIRKVDVSVGASVDPAAWDRRRQRVKADSREAAELNLRLSAIEQAVSAFFARVDLVERRHPSRDEVSAMLREAAGRTNTAKADTRSIASAMAAYMAAESVSWADGTLKKYRSLLRHIQSWREDAAVDDLDTAGVESFTRHLLRGGVCNATATKYVKALLAFLRWAHRCGIYRGTAHEEDRMRLKDGGNGPVYLTIAELRRMEDLELDGTAAQVRDVFVFCCYTGLRFSDAAKLRHEDDFGDHISVVTMKTADRIDIELNTHARAILDRWRDLPGTALPAISNQKSNEYLKAIARRCGITAPVRRVRWSGAERTEEVAEKCLLVCTHTARRTFVVTALTIGIPAEVIMRWTGHADWKSLRPYVAIVEDLKRSEMVKFDNL